MGKRGRNPAKIFEDAAEDTFEHLEIKEDIDGRMGDENDEQMEEEDDDDDDVDRLSTMTSSTVKTMTSTASKSTIELESRMISSSTRMYNQDSSRARALGIDIPVFKLITAKVEDFNAMLKSSTPDQVALMRDIRKRGKNKVAAMNCRRRKMNRLDNIQDKVTNLVRIRDQLRNEEADLLDEIDTWRQKYADLYDQVFNSMTTSGAVNPVTSARRDNQQRVTIRDGMDVEN